MKNTLLHDYRGYLGGGVDFAYHASLNLENCCEVVDKGISTTSQLFSRLQLREELYTSVSPVHRQDLIKEILIIKA